MRPLTLLMLVCCLLSGCAHGPMPTPPAPIEIPPPANLTSPPQQLPQPSSGQMRDLEANHLQVAEAYHQLAAKYCGLLAFLEINHDACRFWLERR